MLFADLVEVLIAPVWTLAVALIALWLAWLFRFPLRRLLLRLGITKVSLFGVDVEWLAKGFATSYARRDAAEPGRDALEAYALLAARLAPLVAGRRVMWADDKPSGNQAEARLLYELSVDVENELSTKAALERIAAQPTRFHLVISNWVRDSGEAGPDLLTRLRESGSQIPVIFYVGKDDPERRAEAGRLGALALCTEPGDLMRHVLPALAVAH